MHVLFCGKSLSIVPVRSQEPSVIFSFPCSLALFPVVGSEGLSSPLEPVGVTNGNMALSVARSTNSKQSEGGEGERRVWWEREMKSKSKLWWGTREGCRKGWTLKVKRLVYLFLTHRGEKTHLLGSEICLPSFYIYSKVYKDCQFQTWNEQISLDFAPLTWFACLVDLSLLHHLEMNTEHLFTSARRTHTDRQGNSISQHAECIRINQHIATSTHFHQRARSQLCLSWFRLRY